MGVTKNQLDEINIMRPVAIVLLVLLHSFTMYGGGWKLPENIQYVRLYFWIAKFANSFMLEMFVFVSGYLYAYQVFELHRKISFNKIFISKFKRLIVPSIVFSILYSFLFYKKELNVLIYLYDIVNGIGHMWFLPMLFWCFIVNYIFSKIKINEKIKITLLIVLSVFSFIPLPFQIGSTFYYLLYFYSGELIWKNKQKIIKIFSNIKFIIAGFIFFVILFISLTLFVEILQQAESELLINKLIKLSIIRISRIVYASVGLFLFYVTVTFLIDEKFIKVSERFVKFNGICFGIYLYHQFFLQYFYYKSSLNQILGTYWLPIFGFIVTMLLSIFISYLTKKSRLGRMLIG